METRVEHSRKESDVTTQGEGKLNAPNTVTRLSK